MLTIEQVALIMAIGIPLVLAVTIYGYFAFVRFGKNDRQRYEADPEEYIARQKGLRRRKRRRPGTRP